MSKWWFCQHFCNAGAGRFAIEERSLNDSWYTSKNQDETWKSSRWRGKSSEPSISIFGCHVITVSSIIHLSVIHHQTCHNHPKPSTLHCVNEKVLQLLPIPYSHDQIHLHSIFSIANAKVSIPTINSMCHKKNKRSKQKDLHIPRSNASFCQTLQVTNPFEANLLQTSDICQKPMTWVNPGVNVGMVIPPSITEILIMGI